MSKEPAALAASAIGVKHLPTNQLHANPHNPRMLFDKLPLDVLRESISRVGILANCAHFNQGEKNTILSYCSRETLIKLSAFHNRSS